MIDTKPARRLSGSGSAANAAVLQYDGSYKAALGVTAWRRLEPEIRQRFSVKPGTGASIRYSGSMHRVELSLMGWLFAQFCRLFGTPLAPIRGRDVPVEIELVPDDELGGTAWNRRYDFCAQKLFTVAFTKRFAIDGTLHEYIGHGFSMALGLHERHGSLVFVSTGYFVQVAGRSLRIPDRLTPGVTTVTHEQIAGDRFRFTLAVNHPLLGRTIFQCGEFRSV